MPKAGMQIWKTHLTQFKSKQPIFNLFIHK